MVSAIAVKAQPTPVVLATPTSGNGSYGVEVQLSWSQNNDGDFASYKVYRATHTNVTTQDTLVATIEYPHYPQTTDYNAVANPSPGTTYYYRIFVFNQNGQSAASNEKSITLVNAPPTAVTLQSVTPGYYQNEVNLSWTRSYESDIASYKIYRATHASVSETDTLVATVDAGYAYGDPVQYSDSNAPPTVPPGTTYYYRIFVYDQAGQSTGSNELSILRVDNPPAAITLLSVEHHNGGSEGNGVRITWSRSSESDIASYKIYRATHINVTEQDTLVTTVDAQYASGDPLEAYDSGATATVPPGTTYYYRIFVYDQAGQSTGSNELSILRVDSPPAPVTLLSVEHHNGGSEGNGVRLTWSRNVESDIASYKIYRATHAAVTTADTLVTTIEAQYASGDPLEAYDSGAVATPPPGTTYYYRVFVYDGANQSAGSNELSILRVDNPPAAVTLNTPVSANGSYGPEVQLSWSQSGESDFASYKVYRSTQPAVTQNDTLVATIEGANTTQTSDTNAPPAPAPGVTYYYRVFVTDQGGQSAGSNEKSITLIDAPPAAVTLLQPTNDYYPGTVRVRWTRNSELDIATYKVYRATHVNVTEADTLVATIEAQYASGDPIETYDYNAPASLPPGTRYYYRVFVYDNAAQSAGSNEESILQIAPPLQPGTPSFSDVTMTTLKATMPLLPEGATSLTLQKKLASQYDSEYVDVATGLGGDVIVNVTGLEGSTDYVFRAVAIGDGGSTPGQGAGVRTAELPPGAPNAPTFSELTDTSVKVHAPALPIRAEWLRLQGKPGSQPDSAYLDIADQVQANQVTLVSDLSSGESYSFRYVAVGQGGTTPGAAGVAVTPVPFFFWKAHTSISCGGIRWPLVGSNTLAPGTTGLLSSFLATDWDRRDTHVIINGQQSSVGIKTLSDTCTYTWSATGGAFPGGNKGQSAKWTAPTVPGTYTITLVVDDAGGANQPGDEPGARDDAARGYNDAPLKFSVAVTVTP